MDFTKEHAIGMAIGIIGGIGCIVYGMNAAKATQVYRIDARLIPYIGMERYQVEAVCNTDQECELMEERLDAAGWRYEGPRR